MPLGVQIFWRMEMRTLARQKLVMELTRQEQTVQGNTVKSAHSIKLEFFGKQLEITLYLGC
jgi:hypothetical protein